MATTIATSNAKKTSKKKTPKPKKPKDPQELKARRQRAQSRSLFARLGFSRISSDGIEFVFDGRTGEVDDIYVSENVMVIAEYTVGGNTSGHVAKKSIIYSKIMADSAGWIDFAVARFPEFALMFGSGEFLSSEFRLSIVYISADAVSDEIASAFGQIRFLSGATFRYFDALGKTIHRTAKIEFYKYLGLEFKDVGQAVKLSTSSRKEFDGHILPESFSSFPKGFKIASFYADPGTLLSMSYVFRRDSWRDEEGMYQRVLQKSRMNDMRKYLTTEKRVFVNNIIVTLPSDTVLNEIDGTGKNIDPKSLSSVVPAKISVPSRSNVIGIIDGQHRVFCYHEGEDKYEEKIRPLRSRQNLLVTGLIFPNSFSEVDRRRFEAKLFLEINDKQKRTGSELKQAIELILNPFSTTSIAKSVIQRLNSSGALKGLLQTNYFDPPKLLKTSSIVSYGLRPLVKLDGEDSIFSAWTNGRKADLASSQAGQDQEEGEELLAEYIEFCVSTINALLIAAKKSDSLRWKLSDNPRVRLLSPTIINGFIFCLRLLIKEQRLSDLSGYGESLKDLSKFEYSGYRSSAWGTLGNELYQKFFGSQRPVA